VAVRGDTLVHHGAHSGGHLLLGIPIKARDDFRLFLHYVAGSRRSLRCGDANVIDHICMYDDLGFTWGAHRHCHVEI